MASPMCILDNRRAKMESHPKVPAKIALPTARATDNLTTADTTVVHLGQLQISHLLKNVTSQTELPFWSNSNRWSISFVEGPGLFCWVNKRSLQAFIGQTSKLLSYKKTSRSKLIHRNHPCPLLSQSVECDGIHLHEYFVLRGAIEITPYMSEEDLAYHTKINQLQLTEACVRLKLKKELIQQFSSHTVQIANTKQTVPALLNVMSSQSVYNKMGASFIRNSQLGEMTIRELYKEKTLFGCEFN